MDCLLINILLFINKHGPRGQKIKLTTQTEPSDYSCILRSILAPLISYFFHIVIWLHLVYHRSALATRGADRILIRFGGRLSRK